MKSKMFSLHEWDVGLAKVVLHIRLHDASCNRDGGCAMQPAGMITESHSPYTSPVMVQKKSVKIRMCIDHCTLSSCTLPDLNTVPRVEDALDGLLGSQWFSVLDLQSGYYQITLGPGDKEKTAFICPLGFYQFERMPQGLSGLQPLSRDLWKRL